MLHGEQVKVGGVRGFERLIGKHMGEDAEKYLRWIIDENRAYEEQVDNIYAALSTIKQIFQEC